MIGHAAGLRRLDGIIWAIIIALAVIMLLAPLASNFQLLGRSFATAGGATALSLAGYWLYQTRQRARRNRADRRLRRRRRTVLLYCRKSRPAVAR